MRLTTSRLASVAMLSAVISCSSDSVTDIGAPPALRLQLTPAVDTIFVSDSFSVATTRFTLLATSFDRPVQTPKGVEWTIGNSSVATVDSTGAVHAVALGSTTLTARVNAAKAHATVVVDRAVAQLVVSPSVLTGVVGDSVVITAVAVTSGGVPVPGTIYSFTTPDPTAVSLVRTGNTTARAKFLKAGSVRVDIAGGGQTKRLTGTIQSS
jgi:hypothetical protein